MKFLYFVLAISIAHVYGSPAYEYVDLAVSSENSMDTAEDVEDNKLIYTMVSTRVEARTEDDSDLGITTAPDVPHTDPEHCTCGTPKISCEDGWVTLGHKCLKLKYTPETYVKAFNICRDEHNARIFTIQSQEDQTFFEKLFIETGIGKSVGSASKFVYMGLERCPRTGFHWVGPNETKIPVTYENWDIGEPQSMAGIGAEACAAMILGDRPNASYGKWHDYGCDAKHMFVCEREEL